jgi:hypothetical protein
MINIADAIFQLMSDEQTYEHQWTEGEWHRFEKGDHHLTRIDVCELCGCERIMLKVKQSRYSQKKIVLLSHYYRSKIFFGENEMPDCWGAKNPQ